MNKSKTLLEIGAKGYLEHQLIDMEVAQFASAMNKFIQVRRGANKDMNINTQIDILMSEVDAVALAYNGGESAQVVWEECIAAAVRLLQIASSVQSREDDINGNADTAEVE